MTFLSCERAAEMLRRGGIVVCPTEGVWGLSCDPGNADAVMRLLAIKARPIGKGLILVAADLDQLKPWVNFSALPPDRLAAVLETWPGPHTWIIPADPSTPNWVTGNHKGVAVRVTHHAPMAALCHAFGGALVSTSANFAGSPAETSLHALDPQLLQQVDGIAPGDTGGLDRPTPIVDAMNRSVLRG